MYTLKSIARRGTSFAAAMALVVSSVGSAVLPAMSAYADALNPLTDRSLTLSSSSPGWANTDGSGNSTYAPPNSGANGGKTGNTFEFSTSSNSTGNPIKAFTFQYCTAPAGLCRAPGDDAVHGTDTATTSDLKVTFPSPAEVANGDFATVVGGSDGIVKAVPGMSNPNDPSDVTGQYAAKNVAGSFIVYYRSSDNGTPNNLTDDTWLQSEDWVAKASNQEEAPADGDYMKDPTGQNNFITLVHTGTGQNTPANTKYKVVFFGTAANYIQNPGSGAFYVKINTYNDFTDTVGADTNPFTADDTYTLDPADIIDGGVTVANIMNQSIWIQTKVLETMQFSVGTVDPNTLSSDSTAAASELDNAYGAAQGTKKHGVCEPILKSLTPTAVSEANILKLGDQNAESSLSTEHTYSTHSFWRLSSNSSAGATVYYSGHTLSNTVGDQIEAVGPTMEAPARGEEQFGLALALADNTANADESDGSLPNDAPNGVRRYATNYAQEATYENGNDNGKTALDTAGLLADNASTNGSWHQPRLYPLAPTANYGSGAGTVDSSSPTSQFAFDPTSDTIPVPIASESDQVVDCVTGKMRYMANIAATTPAGIYTTKVNYIAAPQY